MITKKIKALAEEIREEVIGIRRHLHQHPELSYHEEETADYLGNLLRNKGLSFEPNIGGHGIVLTIEGNQMGKGVVALRGDRPVFDDRLCEGGVAARGLSRRSRVPPAGTAPLLAVEAGAEFNPLK